MGAEKFRLNAAKKFGTYLTLERAKELRGCNRSFPHPKKAREI
jgi:hypothetical protein